MAKKVIIPDHFRIATLEDFHIEDKPCLGRVYWLHSYHEDTLESHILVPNTDTKNLSEWIHSGHVYIEVSRYEESNKVIKLKTEK